MNRQSSDVSQCISWQKAWFLGCQDYLEVAQRARSFRVRRHFFGLLTVLTRRDGEWDTWNSNIPRSVLFFTQCMRTLFAFICCYDTRPADWVSAQTCPLDRKNDKEAVSSVLCWSGAFVVVLPGHTHLDINMAASKQSSTKGYLLIGRVWLGQQGCQECIASPVHEQQDAGLGPQLRHVDLRLCQKFNREARVVLQCADGELVKPGSSGHHRSSPRRRAW